jgi:hypothetical protein
LPRPPGADRGRAADWDQVGAAAQAAAIAPRRRRFRRGELTGCSAERGARVRAARARLHGTVERAVFLVAVRCGWLRRRLCSASRPGAQPRLAAAQHVRNSAAATTRAASSPRSRPSGGTTVRAAMAARGHARERGKPRRPALAFAFLTRLPVRAEVGEESLTRRSLAFFPLVGLVLGWCSRRARPCCRPRAAERTRAVPLVGLHAALSGGPHLDGRADTGRGRRGRAPSCTPARDPAPTAGSARTARRRPC